jgi:hypothetical protein
MVVLAPLAVGMGVAKAGAGILGAIGANQSATAQARAQNQAAVNRYKLAIQQRDYDYKVAQNKYANQLGQYDMQTKFNQSAANRAYAAEDLNMVNMFKSAAFQQQALAIQAAAEGGTAAASGKSGRSARRLDRNLTSQYARNLATLDASIASAQEASSIRKDKVKDSLTIANYRAYAPVSIGMHTPMELPEPMQVSGPSNTSLMTNIGGALLDGASSMFSLNSQLG